MAPVGIFDSGVGGLTVARAIIDQLPDEDIIYVGDTANGPYGPLTIPEIRAHALLVRRGFGSVKVEATIRGFTWHTSVFPSKSSGGYFLPVKIEALRNTGIAAGDEVTVELELL